MDFREFVEKFEAAKKAEQDTVEQVLELIGKRAELDAGTETFLEVLGERAEDDARRSVVLTLVAGEPVYAAGPYAELSPELPAGGLCYNYGTTDFSRPVGLGWDVVRGQARFWVSVSDLLGMRLSFEAQDRTLYRQVLPLDGAPPCAACASLDVCSRTSVSSKAASCKASPRA